MNDENKPQSKNVLSRISSVQVMYVLASVVSIFTIILLVWFFVDMQKTDRDEYNRQYEQAMIELHGEPCVYQRILDGVCVKTGDEKAFPIAAVMVENHYEAWPQSGLSQASIVYEAPVEGNIPRFMALYPMTASSTEIITQVGPVRSARPYYLDWAHEYDDLMYMHVGGAPVALDRIKTEDINDLNQFWHGNSFWRSSDRYAPHNVYTSPRLWTAAWDAYFAEDAVNEVNNIRWQFADWPTCEENCVDEIFVQFAGDTYSATWEYSDLTHNFIRSQAGSPHADVDGTIITADTIIIQEVHTEVIDELGRQDMDTIGEGNAYVFARGYVTKGTWKKESLDAVTMFYDEYGDEIALHPGKIWIEVMGTNTYYEYSITPVETVATDWLGNWDYASDAGDVTLSVTVENVDEDTISGTFFALLNLPTAPAARIDNGIFSGEKNNMGGYTVSWEGDRDDSGTADLTLINDHTMEWDMQRHMMIDFSLPGDITLLKEK